MSKDSKKSLYAFLLKTALKKRYSQSNKYPPATLSQSEFQIVFIVLHSSQLQLRMQKTTEVAKGTS